ncbi:hypothetical protein [Pantoea stewartii]|uniref:Uncharacterized protein n=1 Tax=Pantoea stewartii subsp. stewartii DC283 TaxID=660596 RepID=H3REC3_PANSE|nr:hypothetical protein [Pantoea stewartii]ARF50629.1 hypothetical protein DSJ_15640 [Pantoea stewartii subsp. stewartii DC283]EHU00099.1 hypothetical protein CKS_2343 [Pantoea stewartii subsp. stewartii DC283]KAB0554513.1 hypothetical protein F7Q90_12010 [Pantoea stewartii subsp. stewartii]
MFALILVPLIVYIQLGWCWADALLRLKVTQPGCDHSYRMSFIFWPVSMMLWDAQQQEADSDY